MSEYFGKRGMSVSVEVFIMKLNDLYSKVTYLVALDRCDQNAADSLSIADLVLSEFSKDFPNVVSLRIKTDNAGSYHANGVFDCMHQIGTKYGINIFAYDYNEAQMVCFNRMCLNKFCSRNTCCILISLYLFCWYFS